MQELKQTWVYINIHTLARLTPHMQDLFCYLMFILMYCIPGNCLQDIIFLVLVVSKAPTCEILPRKSACSKDMTTTFIVLVIVDITSTSTRLSGFLSISYFDNLLLHFLPPSLHPPEPKPDKNNNQQ